MECWVILQVFINITSLIVFDVLLCRTLNKQKLRDNLAFGINLLLFVGLQL